MGWAASDDFEREVLSDRPFAFYRLNEAPPATLALDESGNLLNGAYSATGTTLQELATAGDRAVGFGGGWVVVDDHPLLNPEHISIEAVVVWHGSTGAQQRICEKSTEPSGSRAVYNLCISSEGTPLFQVDLGLGAQLDLPSCVKVPENRPIHLVGMQDGSTLSLYVDGVLATSIAEAGTLVPSLNSRPLTIGNQVERDRSFNGLIDELVLYDHALTPARVLSHARTIPELAGTSVDCQVDAGPDGSGGTAGDAGDGGGDGGTAGSAGTNDAGGGPSGSGGVAGDAGSGATSGGATGLPDGAAGSNLRSKPTVDIDGGCTCALRRRDQSFFALIGAAALAVLIVRRRARNL